MYIQSKTKDVIFTVVAGLLLLSIALSWNSGRITKDELEITKFKLSSCESNLKSEKLSVARLKEEVASEKRRVLESMNDAARIANKATPTIKKYNSIMEMLLRRMQNGELSKSMIKEYEQILEQ